MHGCTYDGKQLETGMLFKTNRPLKLQIGKQAKTRVMTRPLLLLLRGGKRTADISPDWEVNHIPLNIKAHT